MPATTPVFRGFGQNITTGNGLIATYSSVPNAAGIQMIMFISMDNLTATTPTVTGITKPGSETNVWSRLYSINSPQSASGGGVRTEVWGITTTVSWVGISSSTITFSSASTLKKMWHCFSTTGADLDTAIFQQAAVGVGITTETEVGKIYAHYGASENNAFPTIAPVTGGLSWLAAGYSDFTSGGGAAANVSWAANWGLATSVVTQSFTYTGGSDGGHLVMSLAPLPPAPATVLNIGTGAGQNHFRLQYSPRTGAAVVSKTQAELAAGFAKNDEFTVPSTYLDRVRFTAQADGAIHPGSNGLYAGSDLREVNDDGTDIAYDVTVGEHIISGRSEVFWAPGEDKEVILVQLANSSASLKVAIGTEMNSDYGVRLTYYINDFAQATSFMDPYFGSEIQWKIRIISGVVEFYITDMVTPALTYPTPLAATAPASSWFFRVGLINKFSNIFLGVNGDTVPSYEYSAILLRDLSVFHNFDPIAGGTDVQKIAIGSALVGIDKLYIGTTKVNRVYVGTTMVYDDA